MTETRLPDFDWSGVQAAVEHLGNNGLVPLADAVRSLDAHDTAASSRLVQLIDDIVRAAQQLDVWLERHEGERDAYLVGSARQLLAGEAK